MKIRSDGENGWKLLQAPPGTELRRVTITFPSKVRHTEAGGKNYISGPAKVEIRVVHADGTSETRSGVAVEWPHRDA